MQNRNYRKSKARKVSRACFSLERSLCMAGLQVRSFCGLKLLPVDWAEWAKVSESCYGVSRRKRRKGMFLITGQCSLRPYSSSILVCALLACSSKCVSPKKRDFPVSSALVISKVFILVGCNKVRSEIWLPSFNCHHNCELTLSSYKIHLFLYYINLLTSNFVFILFKVWFWAFS